MKIANWFVLPTLIMLAACNKSENERDIAVAASADESAPQNKFGFREPLQPSRPAFDPQGDAKLQANAAAATAESAARAAAAASPAQASSQQSATAPKIAYAYSSGFSVSAKNMPVLQQKHAQLCETMGPQSCRVMQMSQSSSESYYASGSLEIEVAASKAKAFGNELGKVAEGAGGEQTSSAISGEDLSKQIVDTEARLQARLLLRNRLMELLASHKGSVAELIEAERGVADVNEEIDEAQRLLKDLNGRIEFSRVAISYQNGASAGYGFSAPIAAAFRNLGSILGTVIAGLIVISISLLPIILFIMSWRWAWRRGKALLGRIQARAKALSAEEQSAEAEV